MDNSVNELTKSIENLGHSDAPWPRSSYSWYVVIILLLAYTLSFVDRMILSLLVAPIRSALDISDTQVSLLIGLAFALFYTVLGLPLAWIADHFNRRNLIIAGVALWSMMTAACGFAGSYASLFAARMGVGVGEATLTPAAFSMLSDYFPREKLARAMAVYSIGVPLGSGIALILGAFIVQTVLAAPMVSLPYYGEMEAWRLIFVWVAVPGLLVVALLFTVREPLRRGLRAAPSALAVSSTPIAILPTPSLMGHIRSQRTALFALFAGMSLIGLVMYGAIAWIPTFFMRSYGLSISEAGLWFGIIMAIGGTVGLLAGGALADYLYTKGVHDAHMRVMRLSVLVGGPPWIAIALMPDSALAFGMLALAYPCMTMHGVGSVALQLITPNQYRARMTAFYFFVVNLIGLGFGPLLIALLTDYLFQDDASLRYSIATIAAIALPLAALILTWGFKSFAHHLRLISSRGAD